jgi:hypothetical protein
LSAASARRLKRLEGAAAPRDLGQYHCVYARDLADYERQKAGLIASGRAKATDLIFDANWQSWQQRGSSGDSPEYVGEVKEPETHAWTMTHDERVFEWSREKMAQ